MGERVGFRKRGTNLGNSRVPTVLLSEDGADHVNFLPGQSDLCLHKHIVGWVSS